jgi:hypothetical protein
MTMPPKAFANSSANTDFPLAVGPATTSTGGGLPGVAGTVL